MDFAELKNDFVFRRVFATHPDILRVLLRRCGADLDAVPLLAQALGGEALRAEPDPGARKNARTIEQRAIDTLLASFQDVVRSSGAGPLPCDNSPRCSWAW